MITDFEIYLVQFKQVRISITVNCHLLYSSWEVVANTWSHRHERWLQIRNPTVMGGGAGWSGNRCCSLSCVGIALRALPTTGVLSHDHSPPGLCRHRGLTCFWPIHHLSPELNPHPRAEGGSFPDQGKELRTRGASLFPSVSFWHSGLGDISCHLLSRDCARPLTQIVFLNLNNPERQLSFSHFTDE